jgi:transmembrane sensor
MKRKAAFTSGEKATAEAVAWRVRLCEEGADARGFESWLASDPHHARIWAAVQTKWAIIDEISDAPELTALRAHALDMAEQHGDKRANLGRRRLIAAVGALAVTCAGAALWRSSTVDVYATGLGERRTVALSDGSEVALDSNSRVAVRFTRKARNLQVSRGQVRFAVAHEPSRPFRVVAGKVTVVATGTVFNVDLLGPKVLVTLVEGRVAVLDHSAPGPTAYRPAMDRAPAARIPVETWLTPGQQLVTHGAAPPTVRSINPSQTLAWEEGLLVFDNEPLSAIAERFSRYANEPLRVSPDAADLRISGVFKAGDLDGFVAAMTAYLPLVAERDTGSILLRRRT